MGRELRDVAEQTLFQVPALRSRQGGGTGASSFSLDHLIDYKPMPEPHDRLINGAPSSREINLAIEVLARSGVPPLTVMALDIWNASRIRAKAPKQPTLGDIQRLIAGLDRRRLSEAGIL